MPTLLAGKSHTAEARSAAQMALAEKRPEAKGDDKLLDAVADAIQKASDEGVDEALAAADKAKADAAKKPEAAGAAPKK